MKEEAKTMGLGQPDNGGAQSNSSSSSTVLNEVYDNEVYINSGNNQGEERAGNSTQKAADDQQQQQPQPKTSNKMGDFVNFDRVEAENGGYERENYATCLVEGSPSDGQQIQDQAGRLNFWQPINNRGVMHLVAHYTYKLAPAKQLRRRESFRAPIERAPSDSPTALDKLIRSNHLERDQIWLVNSCDANFTPPSSSSVAAAAASSSPSPDQVSAGQLLAELTRQQVDPATVEVDSELVVGQFNLTGLNEIANKHLLLFRRRDERLATRIACCKVIQTDTMPAIDLPERANKTIQATRDYHQSSR